jgi:hypothetical protein
VNTVSDRDNICELIKKFAHPRQGKRIEVRGLCFAGFSPPLILTCSPQGEKGFLLCKYCWKGVHLQAHEEERLLKNFM